MFVHGPPEPIFDTADHDVHFIQMPAGTMSRFPLAQFFGQERRELDVPLAKGFVTDDSAAENAAFVKQFLHITLAEGKAVAVGLPVSHSSQPTGLKSPEPSVVF